MDKVDSAVEEVGKEDPVDNGSSNNGKDWEDSGQVRGPLAKQNTTQIIELRDLGFLT